MVKNDLFTHQEEVWGEKCEIPNTRVVAAADGCVGIETMAARGGGVAAPAIYASTHRRLRHRRRQKRGRSRISRTYENLFDPREIAPAASKNVSFPVSVLVVLVTTFALQTETIKQEQSWDFVLLVCWVLKKKKKKGKLWV